MMKKGDKFPPIGLHHHLAGKRIIVAGAGIAGLSFAIALRRNWEASFPPSLAPPSIVIYERESKDSRVVRAGYSMTIRSDGFSGGMQSTQKLGLLDKMLAASVTGSQGGKSVIWDPSMKPLVEFQLSEVGRGKNFPVPATRISRTDLRRVLIDGLNAQDEVRLTVSCTGAKVCPGDGGKVKIRLSDGSVDELDLLIAADGARSKLRGALRPDDGLRFTGVVTLGGYCALRMRKRSGKGGGSPLGVCSSGNWKGAVPCACGPAKCELECELYDGETEGLGETTLRARADGRDAERGIGDRKGFVEMFEDNGRID